MDYKKKYLKYKLKYLTAKKLYGGMDPGPDENEEMGSQEVRHRSNALTPRQADEIVNRMNYLGLEELDLGAAENENTCMNVEELGDRIDELSQEVRYLSEEVKYLSDIAEEVKYLSDIATNSDSDSDIDLLYGEPKSSPSSSRSPSPMRMDYSFEERKKGEKRGREESPELPKPPQKLSRIPGANNQPARPQRGPDGDPIFGSPPPTPVEERNKNK